MGQLFYVIFGVIGNWNGSNRNKHGFVNLQSPTRYGFSQLFTSKAHKLLLNVTNIWFLRYFIWIAYTQVLLFVAITLTTRVCPAAAGIIFRINI
jgi:hypothetical protein